MNKEELLKKFEENVRYLKRNIPPDDIYIFAEQTFMAAMYFMNRWCEWIDIAHEADSDPIARKWMTNLIAFQLSKERNQDIQVDLDLDLGNIEE